MRIKLFFLIIIFSALSTVSFAKTNTIQAQTCSGVAYFSETNYACRGSDIGGGYRCEAITVVQAAACGWWGGRCRAVSSYTDTCRVLLDGCEITSHSYSSSAGCTVSDDGDDGDGNGDDGGVPCYKAGFQNCVGSCGGGGSCTWVPDRETCVCMGGGGGPGPGACDGPGLGISSCLIDSSGMHIVWRWGYWGWFPPAWVRGYRYRLQTGAPLRIEANYIKQAWSTWNTYTTHHETIQSTWARVQVSRTECAASWLGPGHDCEYCPWECDCTTPGKWSKTFIVNPEDCTMAPASITGTVFSDPERDAYPSGDSCTDSSASPLTDSGYQVRATNLSTSDSQTTPVGADGNYTLSNVEPGDSYIIALEDGSGALVSSCSCPGNCQFVGAVPIGATITRDFYTGPPGPWWQVIDGDVLTNGSLSSLIPSSCSLPGCNPNFILDGPGGYPGVAIYGGSSYDFSTGSSDGRDQVSSQGWLANSSYLGKEYHYSYFARLVPSDVQEQTDEITEETVTGGDFNSGGSPARGYIWYKREGDLTINGNVNLVGTRKVVLFVNGGDLNINGRINLQSGESFFMAIVGKDDSGNKGNIIVDPSVSHPVKPGLEGIFLADSQFKTGSDDKQLYIRGSVAAWEGIVLERDLDDDNSDTPAELFEYAPDLIFNYPQEMLRDVIRWREVAP